LESFQTHFEVMVVLLDAIDAWLDGEAIDPCGYPKSCRQAIITQNRIGWLAFLQGYWATEWPLLQDAHLARTHTRTHTFNGQTWATRTITTRSIIIYTRPRHSTTIPSKPGTRIPRTPISSNTDTYASLVSTSASTKLWPYITTTF
jgi:hypothetical protein